MKKSNILYTLLIFFIGYNASAQITKKLNQGDDTFTYKKINLVDFNFSGTKENKNTPKDSVIFQKSSTTNAMMKSLGALSVSETGAAIYDIPIEVPQGINGVQPAISINYNSQAGSGIAGTGWNIKGISSIKEVPATEFHGGFIDHADPDDQFMFALDGNVLFQNSVGDYGGNNVEYKTETYSNIRITSHGSVVIGGVTRPQYFKVYYPDGSIAEYGRYNSSRSINNYSISYWQNPQGLRITYSYSIHNGSQYLDKINYGNVNNLIIPNEIIFDYLETTIHIRNEQSYIKNINVRRSKVLKKVNTWSNGIKLKSYELNYLTSSLPLKYPRLTSIIERNEIEDQVLASVSLNYRNYGNIVININSITTDLNISDINQTNARIIPLEYSANNSLDFIIQPTSQPEKDKFWLFFDFDDPNTFNGYQINTGSYESVIPTTFINYDDKLLSQEAITLIQRGISGTDAIIEFNVFVYVPSNPVNYQYTKTVPSLGEYEIEFCEDNIGIVTENGGPITEKYISGDFNGDGFTDVFAIPEPYYTDDCMFQGAFCECFTTEINSSSVRFIELRQDKATDFISNVGFLESPLLNSDKIETADFNGDGKTDLWIRKDGQVKIYGLDVNNNLQLLATITNSIIQVGKDFLIGDYNGDGKSDFMVPQGVNSNLFRMFLSTGSSFTSSLKSQPFTYKESTWNGSQLTSYIYIPTDVNGDGKTDISEYKSITQNNSTTGSQHIKSYENRGIQASQSDVTKIRFQLTWSESNNSVNLTHGPVPIFINSNKPNRNLELAVFSDQSIYSFEFFRDYRQATLINKFETFGQEYEVEYGKINSDNPDFIFPNIYTSSFEDTYPYVNIQNAPSLNVVSEVSKDIGNSTLKKEFYYHDAVFHGEGLGFLGFKGIASTNWHVNNNERIFTISEYDPHLRGALIKQYERNYFSGFNDDSENFITRRILQYTSVYDDDDFFTLKLDSEHFTDNIKNTYLYTLYQYDDYFNPRRIDKINETGSTTTTLEYFNNNSLSHYYIGRNKKVTSIANINGESFSTTTNYVYENDLLVETSYSGNETQPNLESYEYDVYGNVTKQTVTPHNEEPRIIQYEYDNSGRFLEKSIDGLGLETVFNYDYNTGLLLNTTNHLGQVTTYQYDEWYRLIELTDFLENKTTTSYDNLSNSWETPVYSITSISDDGSESESIYNHLGNIVLSKTKDISGDWVKVSYEYDQLGRPFKVSEPYKGENPTQWNETEYDYYGRVINQFLYTGKTISINYNDLTTTVDDGVKVVSTTIDDFGRTTSVTDPGGTILYDYYANGGLKSANFEGVVVEVGQDGWGRRTSLNDPSAGTYEYEYNGFGEIIKEITPKGETNYYYSSNGLLEEKFIDGDNTYMSVNYNYYEDTKFLESISTLSEDGNNSLIKYVYNNNYGQIESIEESTPYANFKKSFGYDGFGRVQSETYHAMDIAHERQTSKSVRYSYVNGFLKNMYDSDTEKNIFEVSQVNQRGQLTDAIVGSNEKLRRVYDEYGYIKSNLVFENSSTLMERNTDFDPITGNLLNRSSSVFSWSETFEYDDLDRLISTTDNNGTHTMNYDDYGRVNSDTHLGSYNYSGTSYQPNDIDLNIRGDLHYQRDQLQQISYNAFKKPHEIHNQGIERIGFQYNAFEQRSNMFYGSLEEEPQERRKRKHYSFDGSMEIIYDKETDETTLTTFVGGDAYSAPAMWKSVQGGETEHDDRYYFLHRDYLGSIVLITDGNGTALERRHFDAWGNIEKLTDGQGNPLEKLTITDRGYTGHEHLQEVGLIHMNGRLYDPNLKRMLSPDNYIQDMSNSQNFNRYAYVMNNPLKYVDPSGMMYENSGGLSPAEQTFAGNLIGTAYHFLKDATIGRWLDNAIWQPVKDFFGGLFGKKEKNRTITISNYEALNNDPMVGPSTRVQDSFFDGGGDIVGSLGLLPGKLGEFQLGTYVGYWQGLKGTGSFLKGLVTGESWTSMGDGIKTLSDPVLTMKAGISMYINVKTTIERMPEMSPFELGTLNGRIQYTVAESILLTKGAGATANGLKSLKYLRGFGVTTSDGFLFGSVGFKTPINLNVGLYASQNTIKYGTFKWSTIAPRLLTNNSWFGRRMLQISPDFQKTIGPWSNQTIPKGTYIRVGLVGPQPNMNFGTWLQFYAPKGVNFVKN